MTKKKYEGVKHFIKSGIYVTVVAPHAVKSGSGLLVNGLFGIVTYDALPGEKVELGVTGFWDIPKDGSVFVDGNEVYWDDTAKKATSSKNSNTLIGFVSLTEPTPIPGTVAPGTLTGDATVRTRLTEPDLSRETIATGNWLRYACRITGGHRFRNTGWSNDALLWTVKCRLCGHTENRTWSPAELN